MPITLLVLDEYRLDEYRLDEHRYGHLILSETWMFEDKKRETFQSFVLGDGNKEWFDLIVAIKQESVDVVNAVLVRSSYLSEEESLLAMQATKQRGWKPTQFLFIRTSNPISLPPKKKK